VTAVPPCRADACLLSPAHVPQCIAVAASDETDARWADSNYGSCVDLYAPGVDITSAMFTSATATIVASGTSMACPMVSGVAAQYLQVRAQGSGRLRVKARSAVSSILRRGSECRPIC